jgi:predicted ATPase/DNA-binding CsgD family transcriptional regulator
MSMTTDLIGRDDELAVVVAAVRSPTARCTTLTGMAGVGKTALARQARNRLLDERRLLVPWVSLEDVHDPSLVPAAVAAALDVQVTTGSPLDAVASRIGRDVVLVLDNLEHLLPEVAATVVDLLARVPSLHVLATSQIPLRLAAERVITLAPLAVGESADPSAARRAPAVQLYLRRAAESDSSFVSDDAAVRAAAALCRELEGLPLAIELAAARAASLPAALALDEIRRAPLDTLRAARSDRPARHHDLRSAIAWSFALLDDGPRRLLARVSVAAGASDLEMVVALAGADPTARAGRSSVDDLSSLVEAHLVRRIQRNGKTAYVLPSAVRVFAAEQLVASGDEDEVVRLHVRTMAERVRDAMWAVQRPDAAKMADQLGPYVGEALACVATAVEWGEVAAAVETVAGLCCWWSLQGLPAAHEALAARALALAEGRDDLRAPRAIALAVTAQLTLLQHLGGGGGSNGRWRDLAVAEQLAREVGDPRLVAHVLACRTPAAALAQGRSTAVKAAEEGLRLALGLDDQHLAATFDVQLAMFAHVDGAPSVAWDLACRAAVRGRSSGNDRAVVLAAMIVRPLAAAHGWNPSTVVPTLGEALELARSARLASSVPALEAMLAADEADRVEEDPSAGERAARLVLGVLAHREMASLQALGLMTGAKVLAAVGDAETAVWLDAVLTPVMPVLRRAIPVSLITSYDEVMERARTRVDVDRIRVRADGFTTAAAVDEAVAALERYLGREAARRAAPVPQLTARQQEVLLLLASGLGSREIGERLGCTTKTVTHHLSAVYERLSVRTRSEAIAWAFRHGLAPGGAGT